MRLAGIALLALALLGPGSASAEQRVSVALVLAVDVSTSVNDERFQLQRQGYAAAFTHPAVIDAIQRSARGRIAVALVEWAGADAQRVIVPWTVVADAESGEAFAAQLLAQPRPFDGWTSISAAIGFAVQLLDRAPAADRRVIDISGDGVNNSGPPVEFARDAALAREITINGLVIRSDGATPHPGVYEPNLEEFYRDNVIGGPGAFVIAIADFDSFAYAIVGKIIREVASQPTRSAEVR